MKLDEIHVCQTFRPVGWSDGPTVRPNLLKKRILTAVNSNEGLET